jgi:hypothetical protein
MILTSTSRKRKHSSQAKKNKYNTKAISADKDPLDFLVQNNI